MVFDLNCHHGLVVEGLDSGGMLAGTLKSESTTQSADRAAHSAIIFSTRVRPKSSPRRLRASRMPSLNRTKNIAGLQFESKFVITDIVKQSQRQSGASIA